MPSYCVRLLVAKTHDVVVDALDWDAAEEQAIALQHEVEARQDDTWPKITVEEIWEVQGKAKP